MANREKKRPTSISKTLRLRSDMWTALGALAEKDNRTENNMAETLLWWCVRQADILELIKKP